MADSSRKKKVTAPVALNLEGVDVAPGVLETIATLAAEGVEGVAGVDNAGLAGLVAKGTGKNGLIIAVTDDGTYAVTLHIQVAYGKPVRDVAAEVQAAVSDALLSQTGVGASNVDVFVDGIVFP